MGQLSYKPGTRGRCKHCGKTIERAWDSEETTHWIHTATRSEQCFPTTKAAPMEGY